MQELNVRLVFVVSSGQRLVFADEAVRQMRAHAQRSRWQAEAGGVLLGRHLLESKDLAVDEVTVPQKEDRRSRFAFFRSKQHSALALARWAASLGTAAYLGLWHTHPERDPSPSNVDRHDWERAVRLDAFEGDRLFFPIVGIDRIRVWAKTRTGPIEELHAARTEDE
jgi:integrative and conjugative element protein (TIGR02256 family)